MVIVSMKNYLGGFRVFNRTRSFKNTLILYFSLFIVIPILLIVSTSYNVVAANNLKSFHASIRNDLDLIEASTLQFFDQVNSIAENILTSTQVRSVLKSGSGTPTIAASQIVTMNALLQNYSVATYNESVPLETYIYLINKPEYYLFHTSSNVRNIQEISNEAWYQRLPVRFNYQVVNSASGDLLFVKRLYDYHEGFLSLEGMLVIQIERIYYENLLRRFQAYDAGSISIYDDQDQPVIQTTQLFLHGDPLAETLSKCKSTEPRILESGEWILGGTQMPGLSWTILSAARRSDLNLPMTEYSKMLIPLILACLLTAILLANLLSDHITQPIRYLVNSMKRVGKGNLSEQLNYRRNDEFQYLITQYNGMVTRLDSLIDQLYQTEQRKKEAEMASLQAQINPHFLYNTLDSITMLAMWEKNDEIIEVVTALSDFFRYSLSKGRDIIPISDEIRQLESYLKIQKLRYEDTLDYSIQIDSRILTFNTIKLILQPIVENSIKHGISPTGEKGTVSIVGRLENGDAIFVIADDGAGCDLDDLNGMLTDSGPTNRSYGIRNVNWRIKNYFGEGYGLHYTKNEPKGIVCTVRIKALNG